jgi:hypothetical protein
MNTANKEKIKKLEIQIENDLQQKELLELKLESLQDKIKIYDKNKTKKSN